jgi:hypothetical protein
MSSLHGTTIAVRAGEKTADDVARATIFSPKYFPAFLACSMTMSGVAGYNYMEGLRRSRRVQVRKNQLTNLHAATVLNSIQFNSNRIGDIYYFFQSILAQHVRSFLFRHDNVFKQCLLLRSNQYPDSCWNTFAPSDGRTAPPSPDVTHVECTNRSILVPIFGCAFGIFG